MLDCRGQGSSGMSRERKTPTPVVESSDVYKGLPGEGAHLGELLDHCFQGSANYGKS